uniref:Tubulin/FtsZ GTPase domain-containing protein n=1 Tax=Tetradesmus obliquus TaxID=3088 RepID=A0A383WL96_TETOB|eukprot:jgi/Sobl393_1/3869/SZX78023.1
MPTITLQVGQCGNQLGNTFWELLQRQKEQLGHGLLAREWFAERHSTATSGSNEPLLYPRLICVDSEAKVAGSWGGSSSSIAPHQLHILGHAGCGNNWACGYHFGVSKPKQRGAAWSSSTEEHQNSRVEQVMEGIRREAEAAAGAVDFLLLASLAGGTGSGTGSALLQELADQFPASTLAAVAVAPGRTGDSPVQSINSCLAMQHLSQHAHAVLLLDNQALLDQLSSEARSSSNSSSSSSSAASQGQPRLERKPAGAAGNAPSPPAAAAAVLRGACLAGVNRLAAEALAGLLWPLSQQDALAGRSSVRQLVATVCADPLTKCVEVCSLSRPAAAWSSTDDTWSNRVKQLSSRLPTFDLHNPSQPVITSAALLIARGVPGTPAAASSRCSSSSSNLRPLQACLDSSWCSANCYWAGSGPGSGSAADAVLGYDPAGSSSSSSSSRWQRELCSSVCSAWPNFAGSVANVYLGSSPVTVAGFRGQQGEPSLTAAVRRSSTGSFMRAAAESTLRLCQAGAYMHCYEQYGCSRHDIMAAADGTYDQAEAYLGLC